MAAMSKAGTLGPFLETLHQDDELDDRTKAAIAEIASDEQFLLAVEDYVHRTRTPTDGALAAMGVWNRAGGAISSVG